MLYVLVKCRQHHSPRGGLKLGGPTLWVHPGVVHPRVCLCGPQIGPHRPTMCAPCAARRRCAEIPALTQNQMKSLLIWHPASVVKQWPWICAHKKFAAPWPVFLEVSTPGPSPNPSLNPSLNLSLSLSSIQFILFST